MSIVFPMMQMQIRCPMVNSVVINYERAVFIGNLVNVVVFEVQNYKTNTLAIH